MKMGAGSRFDVEPKRLARPRSAFRGQPLLRMPLARFGFRCPRLWDLRFFRFFAFLFGIDRKQHEMVEAVAPEITVLPKVEIQLGVFWQPEFGFALGKSHWSILHSLMLAAQLNFLDRIC